MGDAALRVQTKYPTAEALTIAVGTTVTRGALRVPLHVPFEHPFELELASLDGSAALTGTAEVVEHVGDATWIRFQSAVGGDGRCVLVDSEVVSPVSLTNRSEGFDAITAVGDHEPEDRTNVEAAPDVEAAALAALEGHFDAIEPIASTVAGDDDDADLRIPHTGVGIPLCIDTVDNRPTILSPPLAPPHQDTVAKERGVRPITAPYARTPRTARRIVIGSISVAVVSLAIAVGSVMWARDTVAHASHPPASHCAERR